MKSQLVALIGGIKDEQKIKTILAFVRALTKEVGGIKEHE